jgi:hypothetical protein
MNPADKTERLIRETVTTKLNTTRASVWRTIVTNKWTRIVPAAAAVIAIAVVAVTMLNKSATKAYALDQTVEANSGLRFIHIRIEPAGAGLGEAWAQFGEDGQLLRLRMEFPNSEDGPKVTVWQADKAEVWFKAKNSVAVLREPDILARLPKLMELFDPRVNVAHLYQAQKDGQVTMETDAPADDSGPITLVVTSQSSADRREVLYVDPCTKLLQRIEKYSLKGNDYELVSRWDYLDYNQEPDADVFTLNPPEDVMRVDETTQEIGLAKGDLTDEEITIRVVREFFEALIAKDYAKAGKLCGGLPADKLKEAFFKNRTIVRIVSIGTPAPPSDLRRGGLVVPCGIEIEENGVKTGKDFKVGVRPVYSQRDHWQIYGGI